MESTHKIDGSKVIVEASSKEFKTRFFTFRAKLAFAELRQAFYIALILSFFDQEGPIWINTNVSGYAISKILSQLTFDSSD